MQKNGNGKIIRNFGFSRQDLTSFGKPLTNFEIAGEDKAFYPATAMIMNDKNGSVVVRNNTVISPFNLRYAFKNWA